MRIVIAVSIVNRQCEWRASVTPILPILGRGIKFFKSLFKVKHTVVTTQVEQVMAKVSSTCTMVSEDSQARPRALCPPTRKFHQPTIVEACSNKHPYLPTHELLLLTDPLTLDDGSPTHPSHEPSAFACQAPRGPDRYTMRPFGIGSCRAQGSNRWNLWQRPSHRSERYSRSCF